ncbi:MAG: glycosyltransferase [Verrucomicrobiaceae bacterium]|nr:glycosyltransferase [Verrucomicrobiaceae bacterium]
MNKSLYLTRVSLSGESIFIGVVGLMLFTFGFWHQPFIGFEARFAVFAQEMWRHGPSLFPTTYGQPYPDYPATSTFFVWLFSQPFGGVTKLSAVLPTACAAALNLLITYRLLARFSRQWALLTVAFEILTFNFLAEARSISLDQMLATITLFAFYLVYTSHIDKRPVRLRLLPLLLILGFSIRGPLGVVIPAGVVGSYFLLSAQWRHLIVFGLIAAVTLALCWMLLLYLAGHFYGADFVKEVVNMQVTGRMESSAKLSHWYYLISSFGNYALAYPLAVLVVLLLCAEKIIFRVDNHNQQQEFLTFLIGWVVVVIVGLSIPHTKKVRYLLPIVPAIAALAAYPLTTLHQSRVLKIVGVVLQKLLLVFPTIGILAIVLASRHLHKGSESVHLPLIAVSTALIACQLVSMLTYWRVEPQLRLIAPVAAAAMAAWFINLLFVEPLALKMHDSSKLVNQVEALRQQNPGDLVFFQIGKDAAAIKYVVNVNYDLQPIFLTDAAALDELKNTAYLIVDDSELPLLKSAKKLSGLVPVVHDAFDHHQYSVFYLPGAG